MNALLNFVVGWELPDLTFTKVGCELKIQGFVPSTPITSGQDLDFHHGNLLPMSDLVQETLGNPMQIVNDIQITLDETTLTFTITKTKVASHPTGHSAPSEPEVQVVELDLSELITPP